MFILSHYIVRIRNNSTINKFIVVNVCLNHVETILRIYPNNIICP